MSVRLLGRAFYTDLPAHLKLTLLALCDEASEDGSGICIGQARLARKVGATDRTVRSNLAALETRGWLRKLEGKDPKYRTDRWEVIVEMLPHGPETSSGKRPETSSAAQAAQPEAERRADRKSGVAGTGSPLPPTQELPATSTLSSLDVEADHLCTILHELLEANGVKKNAVTKAWRSEAERLLRIDGRDAAEAEAVLRWCQADAFWHSNILSMPKFREQYDQLRLKMNGRGNSVDGAISRHLARAASRGAT